MANVVADPGKHQGKGGGRGIQRSVGRQRGIAQIGCFQRRRAPQGLCGRGPIQGQGTGIAPQKIQLFHLPRAVGFRGIRILGLVRGGVNGVLHGRGRQHIGRVAAALLNAAGNDDLRPAAANAGHQRLQQRVLAAPLGKASLEGIRLLVRKIQKHRVIFFADGPQAVQRRHALSPAAVGHVNQLHVFVQHGLIIGQKAAEEGVFVSLPGSYHHQVAFAILPQPAGEFLRQRTLGVDLRAGDFFPGIRQGHKHISCAGVQFVSLVQITGPGFVFDFGDFLFLRVVLRNGMRTGGVLPAQGQIPRAFIRQFHQKPCALFGRSPHGFQVFIRQRGGFAFADAKLAFRVHDAGGAVRLLGHGGNAERQRQGQADRPAFFPFTHIVPTPHFRFCPAHRPRRPSGPPCPPGPRPRECSGFLPPARRCESRPGRGASRWGRRS